jgi:hypothetical protein
VLTSGVSLILIFEVTWERREANDDSVPMWM